MPIPASHLYKTAQERFEDKAFQDTCLYIATGVFIALWVLKLIYVRVFGMHRTSVKATYDYIVVGSGASGCVVTNRLSTRGDAAHSVLLLEAGSDDACHDMIFYPSYAHRLISTAADWCYSLVENPLLNDRELSLPRGKVLGGSAAINENLYQRPPKQEFDVLQKLGVKGWSYADCLPYFVRSEKTTVDDKAAHHGLSGSVPVGFSSTRSPIGKFSVESACDVGVAKKFDANNPAPAVGVSPAQVMCDKKGMRCSPATALVRPLKKTTVRTEAFVTKVLFEGTKAVGVEWKDNLGMTHTTRCNKEVILCAGAVGTPAILLRSEGVADASPAVGKNLRDLASTPLIYQTRKGISFDTNNIHSLVHTLSYKMSGSGPVLSHPVDTLMYLDRSVNAVATSWPDAATIKATPDKLNPKQMLDKAKKADVFVSVASKGGFTRAEWAARRMDRNIGWFQEGSTVTATLAAKDAVPHAGKGSVSLNESGEVVVDVHVVNSEEDLKAVVPVLRYLRRMCATSPFSDILTQREAIDCSLLKDVPGGIAGDILYGNAAARRLRYPKLVRPEEFEQLEKIHAEIDTDAYLLEYVKAHTQPFGSPVGTCSMAPLQGPAGSIPAAVDSKTFALNKFENLRVADASVLPVPFTVCLPLLRPSL